MKLNLKLKITLAASLLALTGFTIAQNHMPQWSEQHHGTNSMMHARDGAGAYMGSHMGSQMGSQMGQRKAHHEQRQALFKAQLKLTPEQEAAWSSFTAVMQTPMVHAQGSYPNPIEMAKLTTPERLDAMQAVHAKHIGDMSAAMAARSEAVKTFYAVLLPDQQKVFDAISVQSFGLFMHGAGRAQSHHAGHHD